MLELIGGEGPIGRLLDIGTGTGRMLELLAPRSERSIGIDVNHDMLSLARASLGEARLASASVRQGDVRRPPFEAASFDVAVMHHVLHLLDDPGGGDRRYRPAAAAGRAPAGRRLRAARARVPARAPRSPPARHRRRRDALRGRRAAGLAVETSARCCRPAGRGRALTVRLWLLRASVARFDETNGGGVMASVSFELFPPRTPEARRSCRPTLDRLRRSAELRLGHLRRRRQRSG